jgi:hypothetical protein
MSGDARTAYAFQCGNEDLFSVAHDKAGANFFAAAVRRAGYFAMNSSWARKIRCPLLSSRTRSSAHSLPVETALCPLLNQSFLGVDWRSGQGFSPILAP